MATKGTRTTSIAFGTFDIQVSLSKANISRDLKTEYVNEAGVKVTMSGGAGGGSRRAAPGVEKAVRQGDHVIRLPKAELDAIEAESKARWERMEVLEVIDYRQVPTERIEGSYWLQPQAGSARGLYLLHRALRDEDGVAVVKWVAGSREKLGVIRPRIVDGRRALLLSEISFANDFAAPDEDALAINDAEKMMVAEDPEKHAAAVEAAQGLICAFKRGRGAEHYIDTASDDAVDARLALLERLQNAALTEGLEASTRAGMPDGAVARGTGSLEDFLRESAPAVHAVGGGHRAA